MLVTDIEGCGFTIYYKNIIVANRLRLPFLGPPPLSLIEQPYIQVILVVGYHYILHS